MLVQRAHHQPPTCKADTVVPPSNPKACGVKVARLADVKSYLYYTVNAQSAAAVRQCPASARRHNIPTWCQVRGPGFGHDIQGSWDLQVQPGAHMRTSRMGAWCTRLETGRAVRATDHLTHHGAEEAEGKGEGLFTARRPVIGKSCRVG